MEEKNLSEKESLELITGIIREVRSDMQDEKDNSMLIWGYLTTGFALVLGALFIVFGQHWIFLLWWLMPIIGYYLKSRSKKEKTGATGYFNKMIRTLWQMIFYAMIITSISFMFTPTRYSMIQAIIILFMGMGCAVTGILLRFRPLVIGGIANFFLFALCYRLGYEYQSFVIAAAALISLVIPGHLMNRNTSENPS